jgi:hypothetical protein
MYKKWLAVLATAALTVTLPLSTPKDASASAAAPVFRDIAGHWAQPEITAATAAGWINGYSDHGFHPQAPVTRAEFVKMLAAATHIDGKSPTSKWLLETERDYMATHTLADAEASWLNEQGWYKPALAAGYIVPADYGKDFSPNRPITRQEIAVMVDRALGRVYPAKHDANPQIAFQDPMPDWGKGYVKQATDAHVLNGYPNGTFGWGRYATRAEAVAMVERSLTEMHTGDAANIKVSVKTLSTSQKQVTLPVTLSVPAQMIDGRIYVPVRNLFTTASAVYNESGYQNTVRTWWSPVEQQLGVEYGVTFEFLPGTMMYGDYTGFHQNSPRFTADARFVDGEVLIPVYDTRQPDKQIARYNGTWNENTRELTLTIGEPYFPIS